MRSIRLSMRTSARLGILACLLCAMFSIAARAQDTSSTANLRPTPDSQLVLITLRDGSTLIGRVLEVTPTTLRFASAVGELTIPRSVIRDIRTNAGASVRNGEFWPEDPSRTRLFFAPTGRTLRTDEIYFADAYVFFPSFQGGLTDRITLGAGFSLIPGIGLDEQAYYFTPKVGVYASPTLNVSVGALVAGAGRSSDGPFGMGYTVATFGGEDGSVTTGAGFGFARGTRSTNAILLLGGSQRVSRNIALVSENYFYTGGGSAGLLSGGVRFMAEKLAVDLAGFTTTELNGIPIPYVSFIYRF
jgi:hypothetical protein